MRVSLKTVARTLLADRMFDIEFSGYLSNHAKHAIVALNGLDAPSTRIQEYWDQYTAETPYGLQLHRAYDWDKVDHIKSSKDWDALRGKKQNWQSQVLFLQDQLNSNHDGNIDELVKNYVPRLLPGITGALTHGLIHLGWGLDAESDWMTLEGLAYLNFAYVPIDESRFTWDIHDDASPLESFVRVYKTWEKENLQKEWVDRVKAAYDETFHPELVPAGFQWHVAKLVHEPSSIATELPKWLLESDLSSIWKALYRDIAYVFLATRNEDGNGNFVVLHLITSLWALENICNRLDSEKSTRRALALFYSATITLISAVGCPLKKIENIHKDFREDDLDDGSYDWTETVKAGIAEEEEHNIKLVYVMKELWKRYGFWKGYSIAAQSFTLTPQIGGGNTKQATAFE